MDLKELGFYLFMEDQEKKQKEKENKHKEFNVISDKYLVRENRTTNKKENKK